jgi:hypothetical protein
VNDRIADPNGIENFARVFTAALLDRFEHRFSQEVISRFDIDRDDTTLVFFFELRFQLFPIDRFRFPIEGYRVTILHVISYFSYATMTQSAQSTVEYNGPSPSCSAASNSRTAWHIDNDGDPPRFITALPLRRRRARLRNSTA